MSSHGLGNVGEFQIGHIKSLARFHIKLCTQISIGTPKFYIAPRNKINHELANRNYNCDVKSG